MNVNKFNSSDKEIAIIAAVSSNQVIGINNGMPWHLSEDMTRFRLTTTGHTVIMGRKTWDGVGKAFINRQNIVISKNKLLELDGAKVVGSLDEAINDANLPSPIFIIGGEFFFNEGLKIADRIYLTEIHKEFKGEVYFPKIDLNQWKEISRSHHQSEDIKFDFVEYIKRT